MNTDNNLSFKSLTNTNTTLDVLKITFLTYVGISLIAIIGLIAYFMYQNNINEKQIYILDAKSGALLTASPHAESMNERIVEYKAHVKQFYQNWYAFDQFTYKTNTNKALKWVGNSGKELSALYVQENIANTLAQHNMKLSIEIDSIVIDVNSNPVRGACFAKQTITTPLGQNVRYMNSIFNIYDLNTRTEDNTYKTMLDEFKIVNNKVIPSNNN